MMKSANHKHYHWLNPPSTFVALLIQILALFLVSSSVIVFTLDTLSLFEVSLLHGTTAATISYQQKMPKWWMFIHLAFSPALIATLALSISPIWFLVSFLILILIQGKHSKRKYRFTCQVIKQLKASLRYYLKKKIFVN